MKFSYKGMEFTGTVISSTDGTVNIKLRSGYNMSIPLDSISDIQISEVPAVEREHSNVKAHHGVKKVGLLATGGTIASRVDYVTGAVKPVLNPAFLEDSIENITEFDPEIDLMEPVLSENMDPSKWIQIAQRVKALLETNGSCIVLHGTDTMSYTASALAFMFQEMSGPVIMVGSQRSSDRPSSDAFLNIQGALELSKLPVGEVTVAMHYGISDTDIAIHRGVRVRKMHTSRRDAFRTIGGDPLAIYRQGKITYNQEFRKAGHENILMDKLDPKVSMIYFHPALSSEDLDMLLEKKHAAVIMGTGLGHIASRLYSSVEIAIRNGTKIIMASQCIGGRVNMNVYSTGRELLGRGVIPAGSMLPEVAFVKSMFLLGNYDDEDFVSLFSQDMRGEFYERESIGMVAK